MLLFRPCEHVEGFVDLAGLRSSVNGSRAGPEPSLHRVDDTRGDLVLDGEDVDGLPVEPL